MEPQKTDIKTIYKDSLKSFLLLLSFTEFRTLPRTKFQAIFGILRAKRPDIFQEFTNKKRPLDCVYDDLLQLALHYKLVEEVTGLPEDKITLTKDGEYYIAHFQNEIIKRHASFFFSYRKILNLSERKVRTIYVNLKSFPEADDLIDDPEELDDINYFLCDLERL